MASIAELREKLQGPRKPYDTLYGRWVMRRFSIYLTVLFQKLGLTPKAVTALSVLVGLGGVGLLFQGYWAAGILLVNGWYLLDHCDGELARWQQRPSISGLYFDTIANALVAPPAFFALGWSLGLPEWGFAACFGYLMLLIIPYCEAAVVLQSYKGKVPVSTDTAPNETDTVRVAGSPLKKIFSLLHWLVTFPSALPVITVFIFLGFHEAALMLYAVAVSVVWSAMLFNTLAFDKLDKKYAGKP